MTRELPALVDSSRSQVSWSVRRVHTAGETVLDGECFGLSLCVAAAAHHLELPSPSHLAATGCVASDGTVLPVDGLRSKLNVLHDWALGVTTVLTSAAQAEEAGAIAREVGAAWRILGVRTVADAIACAFPNWWTDLQSRWDGDVTRLTQMARDLHRLARDGSNHLLSWRALADVAEAVAGRLPSGEPASLPPGRPNSRHWSLAGPKANLRSSLSTANGSPCCDALCGSAASLMSSRVTATARTNWIWT